MLTQSQVPRCVCVLRIQPTRGERHHLTIDTSRSVRSSAVNPQQSEYSKPIDSVALGSRLDQIKALRRERDQLTVGKDIWQPKSPAVKAQISELSKQIDTLYGPLVKDFQTLSGQLVGPLKQMSELASKISKLEATVRTLDAQTLPTFGKLASAKTELQQAKAELKSLEAKDAPARQVWQDIADLTGVKY